jgi:hypothetical protein
MFKFIMKKIQKVIIDSHVFISAQETEDYLNERAKRASRKKFEAAIACVPDREPDERDRF